MTLATVDQHPNSKWGAKAAAGDALQRAPNEAPFLAVWLNADGALQYSKANTSGRSLAVFATVIAEFAQACYRSEL